MTTISLKHATTNHHMIGCLNRSNSDNTSNFLKMFRKECSTHKKGQSAPIKDAG